MGDLQLEEDVGFERRSWKAQRAFWVVAVALLTAVGLGLFGNGPVSWTTASSNDGVLEASYERFGRRGGSQEFTVEVEASAARGGTWEVEIDRGLLAAWEVTAISPEPESTSVLADAIRFTFSQAAPQADLEVIFAVSPRQVWLQGGGIRAGDDAQVSISQFFYP